MNPQIKRVLVSSAKVFAIAAIVELGAALQEGGDVTDWKLIVIPAVMAGLKGIIKTWEIGR